VIFASDGTRHRILPTPGARATCPGCGGSVVAKCGKIVVHHWAHEAADCDPWYEPMTAWHLGWQHAVPKERREVVMGPHRADAVTGGRAAWVVELQHSPISVGDIAAREKFYGRMIWLFNARKAVQARRSADLFSRQWRYTLTDPGLGVGASDDARLWYEWGRMPLSIRTCRRPVLLDLGDGQVLRVFGPLRSRGWGALAPVAEVRAWMATGRPVQWKHTPAT
jgi:hypothetical protein